MSQLLKLKQLPESFLGSKYHIRGTNEEGLMQRALDIASTRLLKDNYSIIGVGCISRILITVYVNYIHNQTLPKGIEIFDIDQTMIAANQIYLGEQRFTTIRNHLSRNGIKISNDNTFIDFMNKIKDKIIIVDIPTQITPEFINTQTDVSVYELSNIHRWLDISLNNFKIPPNSILLYSDFDYDDLEECDPRSPSYHRGKLLRLSAKWRLQPRSTES
jgi:hypothetical protein